MTTRIQVDGQNVYLMSTEAEAQELAVQLTELTRHLHRTYEFQGGYLVYRVDNGHVTDAHGAVPLEAIQAMSFLG